MNKKILIGMIVIACLGPQTVCKAEENESQVTILSGEDKENSITIEEITIDTIDGEENQTVLEDAVNIGLCKPIGSVKDAENCFEKLAIDQISEGEQNKWFRDLINQEASVEKTEKLRELFPEYNELIMREIKHEKENKPTKNQDNYKEDDYDDIDVPLSLTIQNKLYDVWEKVHENDKPDTEKTFIQEAVETTRDFLLLGVITSYDLFYDVFCKKPIYRESFDSPGY